MNATSEETDEPQMLGMCLQLKIVGKVHNLPSD